MDEGIGVDLISPPEPSDREGEEYSHDPWIRQLARTDIVDREEEHFEEDET